MSNTVKSLNSYPASWSCSANAFCDICFSVRNSFIVFFIPVNLHSNTNFLKMKYKKINLFDVILGLIILTAILFHGFYMYEDSGQNNLPVQERLPDCKI